jgi:NADPH-dependent glutamate synthase beta subunit-like oxidoreductase
VAEPTKPIGQGEDRGVGSGPAGLSAAYHLAKLGYPVTLFEAGKELGGVMRTGIPAYRLPRDVLDREISFIVRHGVEVRTRQRINREDPAGDDARVRGVFVATGLQEARALNLGKVSSDIVTQGIDFLDRARQATSS